MPPERYSDEDPRGYDVPGPGYKEPAVADEPPESARRREAYRRRRLEEQRKRRGRKRYVQRDPEKLASIPLAPPKETREEVQPIYDMRLDEEPYPGETTFIERVHGVTGPYTPPPPAIQALSGAWMRYERWIEGPERFFRTKTASTLERAREAKLKGKDLEAGFLFGSYMGLHALGGIYTGATIQFRPLAAIESIKTGVGLLLSSSRRAEMARAISRDPGLLVALPAAALGAKLTGIGVTKVKGAYQTWKTRRFEAKYPVEAFLPYEESAKFPQTVTTDLPHDIDIESKVPVLWELRGQRASIAISGRTRKGFTLLGHDVKPALIPEGFGKLQTIIERRVRYVPTYTHAPGIPIYAPIYTPPLPSPGLSPLILSGLATLRGPTGLERLDLDTKGQPKSIVDTAERLRERERGRAVTKRKVKTIPEEIVEQWVYTPEIIDVIAEEKIIAIPTAIPIVAPISRARTRMRTRQVQAIPIAIMAMPTMSSVAPPRMKPPPLPRIRIRRRKKRGKGPFGFSIFGEMRGYPVKMPKDILKELGL